MLIINPWFDGGSVLAAFGGILGLFLDSRLEVNWLGIRNSKKRELKFEERKKWAVGGKRRLRGKIES